MKKEIHFRFGLRAKLTCIFILFGSVIAGAAVVSMKGIINEIYTEYYNENLADIAEMAAEYLEALGVGAEEIHGYVQSGIPDERYQHALTGMQEMRERFELESLYIIYPTGLDEMGMETAVWFVDASVEDVKSLGMEVEDYADYASRHVRETYESGERSREMDWTRMTAAEEDGESGNGKDGNDAEESGNGRDGNEAEESGGGRDGNEAEESGNGKDGNDAEESGDGRDGNEAEESRNGKDGNEAEESGDDRGADDRQEHDGSGSGENRSDGSADEPARKEWYVISAYYPIKDAQGNSVAVVGADKTEDDMRAKIRHSLSEVARMILLIVAVSTALVLLFVQTDMVRAIRHLKRGVQKLGEGESGVRVSDGRRDELGEIARAFNRMADSIGRHLGEMEELNCAYQKLIPPGIFEILHKKSIVDFRLGDQADVDLTVLAMEPEGAGRILPELSSKQTFCYINDMLAQTVPAVAKQGGAAWSFAQAGVYSFFRESAQDALEAALLAGRRLNGQGERIAAGIVKGQVMVGVAGHEARMDVISISEQSRIAAFLMRVGKKYQASVLVGRSAAAQIGDFTGRYHVRFLGYLRISASERLEGVYDVFDGDEDSGRRDKQRTKADFERGVLLFTKQHYRESREAFIDVLRQCRGDAAARAYLSLCDQILAGEEREERVWFEELS
ncbi:MAG: HAMP domain-containing protein [bacterium]|nr:HAMP domain-containing protein [bacterium]